MTGRVLRPPRPPRGFTLLELLLVLALLVVLAAVSWPALRKPLASRRLRQAGQAVRIEVARARLEAMRTGQEQGLVYARNGGRLRRFARPVAFDPDAESGVPGSTAGVGWQREPMAPTRGGDSLARWEEVRLPEPILFSDEFAAEYEASGEDVPPPVEVGGPAALHDGEALAEWWTHGDDGEAWSVPIWFRADGTASDAEWRLHNEQGESLRVQVRGLTGSAICDEPMREEPRP